MTCLTIITNITKLYFRVGNFPQVEELTGSARCKRKYLHTGGINPHTKPDYMSRLRCQQTHRQTDTQTTDSGGDRQNPTDYKRCQL